MIDVWSIARNSLWILGLALLLATFSYADWKAQQQGCKRSHVTDEPAFCFSINIGLALFGLGLLATSDSWWEMAAWAVVLLLTLVQMIGCWRQSDGQTSSEPNKLNIT